MNKHIIWMIVGCGIPLLLIFLAPAIGISGDISFFIFIVAMFACHLLMPMHHGSRHDKSHRKGSENLKHHHHE